MEQVQNGTQNKAKSILRKLERYLSINKRAKSSTTTTTKTFTKSRSWNSSSSTAKASASRSKRPPTPNGCFSVHVGPEKQRFVIRTEFANHPLFKMLLEDAEIEYGFKNEGPLLLPCDVDLFCKVLAEMDSGDDEFDQYSCGGYGSCSPFNSGRRLGKSRSAKGYRSYGLLTPPRLLKINNF
ncbi:hypothetical protein Salat_2824600 [Sesamum alatum]|uniref:Uncharacterized protein n=1 Tax=Sesamum alatum TaxID=300844 RepID=A0AAE1XMJ7_9LAMI|nr:hypothetical protein Salat_2824600 [Sesamum alatum]